MPLSVIESPILEYDSVMGAVNTCVCICTATNLQKPTHLPSCYTSTQFQGSRGQNVNRRDEQGCEI